MNREKHLRNTMTINDKFESWGLPLILGAIGGQIYKLVEWVNIKDGCLNQAPILICCAPFLTGIFGMIFLFIANFRHRQARFELSKMPDIDYIKEPKKYPGWLGLVIGTAPLIAGLGGTVLVYLSRLPGKSPLHEPFMQLVLALAVLICVITIIVYHSACHNVLNKLESEYLKSRPSNH